MTFATLALVSLVAILGPLLAMQRRWHLSAVIGELLAGVALGPTGTATLHAGNTTFTFLAQVGFALIMFVAGTHVPVNDPRLRTSFRVGTARAVAVGVISVLLGTGLAKLFHTGHGALYSVLIASSSAALILPIVDSLKLGGDGVLQLIPQVAIADTACIVALPLAIDPLHAGRAAIGAVAVIASATVVFAVLRYLERSGLRKRLHRVSEAHKFALELRIGLAILFALAALAIRTHVSIMLAGFTFGIGVAAIGEPRRLAKQLFALTDGFFGPMFFVWLGASLNLRDLGHHRSFIVLGVALGLSATLAHAVMVSSGQPVQIGVLACAQLGVPVAAATVGSQLGVLRPGEAAALILGALITIVAATVSASLAVRAGYAVTVTKRPIRATPDST